MLEKSPSKSQASFYEWAAPVQGTGGRKRGPVEVRAPTHPQAKQLGARPPETPPPRDPAPPRPHPPRPRPPRPRPPETPPPKTPPPETPPPRDPAPETPPPPVTLYHKKCKNRGCNPIIE
ncbi:hypothetical protein NHX12_012403 [Muraenolepis orangiensis]|uniref:Uncharacterized protein n=1 Tax=Muraenolepis orangiensis TaxID=630683 RepID=A0A9Q0I732_9TELE|nr:hypothetical protein NHX12_012403 [Muraenolepis orangiensis]